VQTSSSEPAAETRRRLRAERPYNGGTHLPDITVVTPVSTKRKMSAVLDRQPRHHADVGGEAPAPCRRFARSIEDEGVYSTTSSW